ncbi:uncharacterized protein LOC112594713 [Melanaphis sacchari]|uniref:uncharacterized protein LOC112594713 n=1 Tax=Melanaphis sacchari TaxID=742174 RepID=UPI000DC15028|nr:uncharacterized protein LOC112594713 [Melanaphis sacchari]
MQVRRFIFLCGVLCMINYSIGCQLSEFMCDTGYCVALDKFCNGNDDCGDKSDEPPYCSPCNRTYHGEVGRTYDLEVRRPREDRLPFLCYLNFTAAGGKYGDIIQLTFDTFTVGKFVSYTLDGCPDGYMSIREYQLPDTGGQWCGSAWGFTVYYSETRSINLTLTLSKLSEQGIGYNFDFKLSYKYLKKSDAHLRYGNSTFQTWRGQMITGSYCDRILDQCDRKLCRVQSPNFPGAYPRNVTCYYRIEQRTAPKSKRALIVVRQPNAHKIHIKDQVINYDRSQRTLRVWDQCNVIQDYLTVYDGSLATDPVLVRLCGGDAVPDIVSSGPNMLLEFHTSAFDNPFHPVPLSYLPGFELDVEILFVDNKSPSYAKNTSQCEFFIKPFNNTNWGLLDSPRHSLPPNTSCKYHFQGSSHQTVWLSFIKYHAASTDPNAYHLSNECNARLRIWDKVVSTKTKKVIGGRRPSRGACDDFPWLIGPATAGSSMLRTGGFVFMKLRGYEIQRWRTNSFMCPTRNRVVVYTGAGDGPKTEKVICPYEASYNALRGSFETFSPGWTEPLTGAQQLQPNSKTVAIEFLNREYGAYTVTWLEVSKMPLIMPSTNVYAMLSNVHPDCAYRCPELNACISSQFWCDGETHCPMGFDEDPVNCADRNGVNLVYVGVLGGTAVVLFTVTVAAAVVCLRCRANRSRRAEDGRRRASHKGSSAVDPMMCAVDRAHYDKRFLEQNGGGGGVVGNSLGKRYPSSSDDLYLDCKQDSMC